VKAQQKQIIVPVKNVRVFEPGMVVYISSVGYFSIISTTETPKPILTLSFLYGSESDSTHFIRNNDLIIPSGVRGVKGDIGTASLISADSEKTYYFGTPVQNKNHPFLKLYANKDDKVITINHLHDIFSEEVQTFHKNCGPGETLMGGICNWNIYSFSKDRTSCYASDFTIGKPGCKNCIVDVEHSQENPEFATKLKVLDESGKPNDILLNDKSCVSLNLKDLSQKEQKECGFFCFFYHLEPLHLSENTFSCRYTPPSHFGVSNFGFSFEESKNSKIHNRIAVITIDLFCANLR